MIMDPSFTDFPNEFKTLLSNSNQFLNRLFPDLGFTMDNNHLFLSPVPEPRNLILSEGESPVPFSTIGPDGASEDTEFSETVLKYISQILMEEKIEQKPSMFYDPLDLQITEKSFYDALGERYPYSPNYNNGVDPRVETPDNNFSGSSSDYGGSSTSPSTSTSNSASSPHLLSDVGDSKPPSLLQSSLPGDPNSQLNSLSGSQFSAPISVNELLAQNIFGDSDSILQFQKGLEEASRFLPKSNQLFIDLESREYSSELKGLGEPEKLVAVKGERDSSPNGSRGRKNHEREDVDSEEERSNKQSAVYTDESELSETFDKVLLFYHDHGCKGVVGECGQNVGSEALQPDEQPQGGSGNGGKARGKKKGKKKETVDLRTLLILCAQAVSGNDRRTSGELLNQIRQHSSPLGDGCQRLAHCFANALEARLAGTGTGAQMYYSTLLSKTSASDILKAYQLSLKCSPFKKMAMLFANKMIYKAAEKATSLHIVDFGILYGFQWPILIKHLAGRPGGPPKLRVTGIEFPQKGFRPAERIEETGRRLANYCARFGVPFKYNAIASPNWETVRIEDIKIDDDEVVAVNDLMRFKNLLDETVEVNCPRNAVLNLIRKMNPAIFVQSIVNGSYNAPFFVTRFREALFHFSASFDVLDTNVGRNNEERLMFEREFYGREAMNVIACEGPDRVERPETYKQWQVRNMRAGFRSLPLNQELMDMFRGKLKAWYHKDFVIDEDNNWMLQGWKGRILYASSCWVPA
ncbi:scarecrow-like protein 14 [Morus notabilis]|nr:scarecrow-like protein 14 [Morus notabilis]